MKKFWNDHKEDIRTITGMIGIILGAVLVAIQIVNMINIARL